MMEKKILSELSFIGFLLIVIACNTCNTTCAADKTNEHLETIIEQLQSKSQDSPPPLVELPLEKED